MASYYNEIDPYAAQWIRNLIAAGYIAPGDVDERSIVDVRPDDLRNYTQCHFFAGIGGWSVALRLAGWDDARPVWTGSCPCQLFSSAGAGKAADDSRHLWPAWFPLIAECRPATIFGEQVEAAIGWGWLDAVFADLESQGYACGTAVFPACSVGAPHIRQRLWFVADAGGAGAGRHAGNGTSPQGESEGERSADRIDASDAPFARGATSLMADASGSEWRKNHQHNQEEGERQDRTSRSRRAGADSDRGLALAELCGRQARQSVGGGADATLPPSPPDELGYTAGDHQRRSRLAGQGGGRSGALGGSSSWSDCDWLPCTNGKARPVESGSFPLAHGVQRRASKLRAYGNAIVPQAAAEFIMAFRPD